MDHAPVSGQERSRKPAADKLADRAREAGRRVVTRPVGRCAMCSKAERVEPKTDAGLGGLVAALADHPCDLESERRRASVDLDQDSGVEMNAIEHAPQGIS